MKIFQVLIAPMTRSGNSRKIVMVYGITESKNAEVIKVYKCGVTVCTIVDKLYSEGAKSLDNQRITVADYKATLDTHKNKVIERD